jgi:hypothetical protein
MSKQTKLYSSIDLYMTHDVANRYIPSSSLDDVIAPLPTPLTGRGDPLALPSFAIIGTSSIAAHNNIKGSFVQAVNKFTNQQDAIETKSPPTHFAG